MSPLEARSDAMHCSAAAAVCLERASAPRAGRASRVRRTHARPIAAAVVSVFVAAVRAIADGVGRRAACPPVPKGAAAMGSASRVARAPARTAGGAMHATCVAAPTIATAMATVTKLAGALARTTGVARLAVRIDALLSLPVRRAAVTEPACERQRVATLAAARAVVRRAAPAAVEAAVGTVAAAVTTVAAAMEASSTTMATIRMASLTTTPTGAVVGVEEAALVQ